MDTVMILGPAGLAIPSVIPFRLVILGRPQRRRGVGECAKGISQQATCSDATHNLDSLQRMAPSASGAKEPLDVRLSP